MAPELTASYGSDDHRKVRWAEYQQRGGEWPYERWLKTYERNMTRAKVANAEVKAYRDKIGWGEVEVTTDVQGIPRKHDIADPALLRAVEVKGGAQYATQENLWEVARDEILMKEYGWKIHWHFTGTASRKLREALKAAGIPIE